MFDLPKRLQTVAKNIEALGPASTSAYLLQAATELNAHRDRITQQDAVIAGLVEALERIANMEMHPELIARAALAKAKESRDV